MDAYGGHNPSLQNDGRGDEAAERFQRQEVRGISLRVHDGIFRGLHGRCGYKWLLQIAANLHARVCRRQLQAVLAGRGIAAGDSCSADRHHSDMLHFDHDAHVLRCVPYERGKRKLQAHRPPVRLAGRRLHEHGTRQGGVEGYFGFDAGARIPLVSRIFYRYVLREFRLMRPVEVSNKQTPTFSEYQRWFYLFFHYTYSSGYVCFHFY